MVDRKIIPLYAPERKREPHPDLRPEDLAEHLVRLSFDVGCLMQTVRLIPQTQAWLKVPSNAERLTKVAWIGQQLSEASANLRDLGWELEEAITTTESTGGDAA